MNKQLCQCAIEAARKAGEILRQGYGTTFQISSKEGRNNLVTEYDYNAEKIIIDYIKSRYPDHEFLAEESGESTNAGKGKVRWIIDPLDGTVNFAHGLPVFSVSIAAEINGEIIAGVIYHPILDEMFYASKGNGAFLNGKKIKVSCGNELDTSFLVTGFPYNVTENPDHCIEAFAKVIGRGIPVRRLGSAALDLAYTAVGRFDGFWETELNPWDVAAGIILVEEAGGKVTNYDKSPYKIGDKTILATNGLIHDEASALLNNCCKV